MAEWCAPASRSDIGPPKASFNVSVDSQLTRAHAVSVSRVSIPAGICRLETRGLKVLVERAVNRTEFSEFSAYDPDLGGKVFPPRPKKPRLVTQPVVHNS